MDAQEMRSTEDSGDVGGQGGIETTRGDRRARLGGESVLNGLQKEAFARDSGEEGQLELGDLIEVREQGEVFAAEFAEAEARVEHKIGSGDAGAFRQGKLRRQLSTDERGNLGWSERGQRVPVLRGATGVHQNQAWAEAGDYGEHGGVPVEAADVVDDLSAGGDRVRGGGGVVSVDGENGVRALAVKSFEHGQEALLLFGSGERCGTGAGGFGSDIEDVGSGVEQMEPARDGDVGCEEAAAIGEGVGGDIEDGHEAGALAEIEGTGAQLPGEPRTRGKGHGAIVGGC